MSAYSTYDHPGNELIRPNDRVTVAEVKAWLERFHTRNGRSLRVLHIGNIANNAYRNAVIQRRIGIEADVVCYDYYHIMGCPEWECAEISGDYDAFMPDWWRMNVSGGERPSWFVQGSLALCLDYLRSVQRRDPIGVAEARLALISGYASSIENAAANAKPIARDVLDADCRLVTERLAPELRVRRVRGVSQDVMRRFERYKRMILKYGSYEWLSALSVQTRCGLLDPVLRRRQAGTALGWVDRTILSLVAIVRSFLSAEASLPLAPSASGYWISDPSLKGGFWLLARYGFGLGLWALLQPITWTFAKNNVGVQTVVADPVVVLDSSAAVQLAAHYRAANPGVPTHVLDAELLSANEAANRWRDVLGHYDVVQGYALDAAIPLFAGHPHVTAYEHGTIRDIPFEASARGRLCRLTYAAADRALITNTDVLPAADRIPIRLARRVCMPHAFDDHSLQEFRRANPHLRAAGSVVRVFCPTRHHWLTPDPSLNKGNDIFLHGVSEAVLAGVDVHIKLVEWGQHVDDSKRLISELGIGDRVTWCSIMNRTQLWTEYLSAHAVADQFTLPALGGVGYESLTIGARLITHIDCLALTKFFGAAPPVLTANTAFSVAKRISELAADPNDNSGVGAAGADWARRYHSTDRVLVLQVDAYRDLVEGPSSSSEPS